VLPLLHLLRTPYTNAQKTSEAGVPWFFGTKYYPQIGDLKNDGKSTRDRKLVVFTGQEFLREVDFAHQAPSDT